MFFPLWYLPALLPSKIFGGNFPTKKSLLGLPTISPNVQYSMELAKTRFLSCPVVDKFYIDQPRLLPNALYLYGKLWFCFQLKGKWSWGIYVYTLATIGQENEKINSRFKPCQRTKEGKDLIGSSRILQ